MIRETPVDAFVWLHDLRHRILNVLLSFAVGIGTLGILYLGWSSLSSGTFDPSLFWYVGV